MREGGCQQICTAASENTAQRCKDVIKAQVHQAVSAEHEIRIRQRVGNEVESHELPILICIPLLIRFNKFPDDVGADIPFWQGDELHPVEVTAGNIEKRLDFTLLKQFREGLPNVVSCLESRTRAGDRAAVAPIPSPVYLVKRARSVRHVNIRSAETGIIRLSAPC